MVSISFFSAGEQPSREKPAPEIITMVLPGDHHPRDSKLNTQAILIPNQAMVSTVTILMDLSTKEAELPRTQAEASGLALGQEGCWDTFLVDRGASPTAILTPVPLHTDLREGPPGPLRHPPPLEHALLQVLEGPREDRSHGSRRILYSGWC